MKVVAHELDLKVRHFLSAEKETSQAKTEKQDNESEEKELGRVQTAVTTQYNNPLFSSCN